MVAMCVRRYTYARVQQAIDLALAEPHYCALLLRAWCVCASMCTYILDLYLLFCPHMHELTDGRTDERTDGRADGRTDGQTDTCTDGRAGGQTDGRMDRGWTDQ